MTLLIGITGKARAGKDTLAQALAKYGYKPVAFADTLKQVAALISGEPLNHFYDDVLKEEISPTFGMTRRRALQIIGTEHMRTSFGPMIWVTPLLRRLEASGFAHCITDVRFDSEAEAIRQRGGVVIRVVRPDNVGLSGDAATHASEQGVAEELVDFEVVNNGTIGDLHHEACKLLGALAEGGSHGS
jgi:hypothetical protein